MGGFEDSSNKTVGPVICKNSKIYLKYTFYLALDINSIKIFELADYIQHVNVNIYLVSTATGVKRKLI